MLLYAISRFVIEFFRGDRARRRRHVLDLAVHLDPPGAARDRHARRISAPAPRQRRSPTDAREQGRREQLDASPVPDDSDGVRLDHFLASVLPDQSRSQIQRLIKDGHVRVDGTRRQGRTSR